MAILDKISGIWAAAKLPALPPAKVKPTQTSIPGYKTQIAKQTSALIKPDRRLAQSDILEMRLGQTTKQVIRDLAAASPDLSATMNAYLRIGIPERFTVVARTTDGIVSPDSTQIANEILRRITFVGDPNLGYNSFSSLPELSATLGKELLLYGSSSLELVLDKTRMPTRLVPVHTPSIRYYEDDIGVRPVQVIGGQEIDLDIPTVFIFNQDQSLLTPYSDSPLESAVQAVLADSAFLNDLRRVMKRAIHPRLVASIIEERVRQSAPPEILNDPDKINSFMSDLISGLESTINGLNPEDALISFDTVEYSYLKSDSGGTDPGNTMKSVQDMINSKLQAGAKTLPAVLGRGNGSGTTASVDTMLFLKNAEMVRTMLNTLLSRALTQAVRLFGQDVYVEFRYADLDMRPQSELEAYRSMEQSRILEQLSLGLITDEEACIKLTGNLPPAGFKPLSGTMFKTAPAAPQQNPNSQTSTMRDGQSTPQQPKGPAKAEVDPNLTAMLHNSHSLAQDALAHAKQTTDNTTKSVSDLAWAMQNAVASQSRQPVNVSVAPSEVKLTLLKERGPKTLKVTRDEDGRLSSIVMEHDDGEQR